MEHKADSTKEMIHKLTELLKINNAYLAGMLGVSEKSLNDWKGLGLGDLTPKAKRLKRLFEVVVYLKNKHPGIVASDYSKLLINGRVTIDPHDEEDGSTALINFVVSEPDAKIWVGAVEEAVRSLGDSLNLQGNVKNDIEKISTAR